MMLLAAEFNVLGEISKMCGRQACHSVWTKSLLQECALTAYTWPSSASIKAPRI